MVWVVGMADQLLLVLNSSLRMLYNLGKMKSDVVVLRELIFRTCFHLHPVDVGKVSERM